MTYLTIQKPLNEYKSTRAEQILVPLYGLAAECARAGHSDITFRTLDLIVEHSQRHRFNQSSIQRINDEVLDILLETNNGYWI